MGKLHTVSTLDSSATCIIFILLIVVSSRAAGALGEAQHLPDVSGGVAGIQSVVAEAAPGMLVGRMVGAVELVLDAEVVELVQHIVGPVRLVPELPEQLAQGRVLDLRAVAVAAAAGVVEHPLRVEQLHPESPDVGAELGARRPGLQHPARGGSQGLSDHPTRRLDAHLHGWPLARQATGQHPTLEQIDGEEQ
jgi:hypothetical protein